MQVRNKLFTEFTAVDEDNSNALDAAELSVLFKKLGLAVLNEVSVHAYRQDHHLEKLGSDSVGWILDWEENVLEAMQVLENITHSIGDEKGQVTFEQLMTALEGTDDDAEVGQGTQESTQGRQTMRATIQPSALEVLKLQQQSKPGGSGHLTTTTESALPRSNRWGKRSAAKHTAQSTLHDVDEASNTHSTTLSLQQYSHNLREAAANSKQDLSKPWSSSRCAPTHTLIDRLSQVILSLLVPALHMQRRHQAWLAQRAIRSQGVCMNAVLLRHRGQTMRQLQEVGMGPLQMHSQHHYPPQKASDANSVARVAHHGLLNYTNRQQKRLMMNSTVNQVN